MKDNNHMPSGRMRAIWLLRWVDPSFSFRGTIYGCPQWAIYNSCIYYLSFKT